MKAWLSKVLLVIITITAASSLCIWYATRFQPVDAGLEQSIRRIVKANPSLQPMLDDATADRILTPLEANAIILAAEHLKRKSQ